MAKDEIPELRTLREEYDRARTALFAGIYKHLALGEGLSRIGRSVDWSREYIARIRDGKVKEATDAVRTQSAGSSKTPEHDQR
ncbi:hypothetical protein ACIBG4_14870 [Nonomuraea sp. NPDC050383]|uniref:hypothetical protein n=1 Tax=Nonomuraea sp. NPDC050383 TaxID=3364362 RepID=UPI0037966F39